MNGRVSSRYEIGHHREGLICCESTRSAAFTSALRWAEDPQSGYQDALRQVRVYDSMARVNQPTTWAYDVDTKTWKVIGLRIY